MLYFNLTSGMSFNIGSCIGNIPIRIHWTFVLLFVLLVVKSFLIYKRVYYTALLAVIYGPILVITILIHEYGHAFMCKHLGGTAHEIVIWPLGGLVYLGKSLDGPVMNDFYISIAGPLTHLPQIGFWLLICFLFTGFNLSSLDFHVYTSGTAQDFFIMISERAIYLNAVIFCFNLLIPAYPLDGGRCLAALLVQTKRYSVCQCGQIVSKCAIIIGTLMILYGLFFIAGKRTGGLDLFYILTGIWIAITSFQLYKMSENDDDKVFEHPLFTRPCYKQADIERRSAVASTTSTSIAGGGGGGGTATRGGRGVVTEGTAVSSNAAMAVKEVPATTTTKDGGGGGSSMFSRMFGRGGGGRAKDNTENNNSDNTTV